MRFIGRLIVALTIVLGAFNLLSDFALQDMLFRLHERPQASQQWARFLGLITLALSLGLGLANWPTREKRLRRRLLRHRPRAGKPNQNAPE